MKLVLAEEMRALDMAAEEELGIPGLLLMENAGRAVADAAGDMLKKCAGKIVIVMAGKGNNGGDGFGAARWLMNRGAQVTVILSCAQEDLSGSAADELQFYLAGGGVVQDNIAAEQLPSVQDLLASADLIIDALLGTGFAGELRGIIRDLCQLINMSGRPVLAVDIPTGVNADDGSAGIDAVRAAATVTMALPKPGLCLYPGRACVGKLTVADIGMPASMLRKAPAPGQLSTDTLVAALLPERPATMHKGSAGRVLVVAGSLGYTGAAALCSTACVKAGAGLVTLLTPVSGRTILAVKLTETMVQALPEMEPGKLAAGATLQILEAAAKRDVLAIGPGLGTSESTSAVIRQVLDSVHVPVIIDADALTALAEHTEMLATMQAPKVLTPHPGELARLLKISATEVEAHRIKVALSCAKAWQAVLVLKGVPTVIACPDGRYYLNPTGNASMATGGSGDVLTGIIAALTGQGLSVEKAAVAGVYLHGAAGDLAAKNKVGLAAGEIAAAFPEARYLLAKTL